MKRRISGVHDVIASDDVTVVEPVNLHECTLQDGKMVAGALSATRPSKDKGSIPWLLLAGTSDAQPGLFANVSSIQRVDTRGGVTGPTVCDPATFGATLKVPYTATYKFYTK
ncbi:DUF3455 domain-containing protein [Enterobacter sp. Cy-643]|uniref:DUF3455 domain-containing protein n=1 Tax=Enterobacter sp. Cy-643 TaxID=2608346 RepID=UPI0014221DBA|nr:DUF3455 domain-containing protein [Enterobacter sp. Cy-643]NIF34367.1 DUF3455 domain-containing protein [Enterobacter sp. Cy-643]